MKGLHVADILVGVIVTQMNVSAEASLKPIPVAPLHRICYRQGLPQDSPWAKAVHDPGDRNARADAVLQRLSARSTACDLAVERGTFYGFLGPNGAGKSTTIKMLTGLLAPSGGQISVLGRNMLDPRESLEAKRRIGVIPEDLALFDNLTAREYLTFVGRIHLMPRETIRSRSRRTARRCWAWTDEEKKLTLEYSHGMKKKLAMAAALLPNPDLLFLDEPFEGVDAVTSRVIRDLLAGFVARGSTVFLTSHVLEIVERLCTHVGIIVKGELVEQASLEAIRQRRLAGRPLPAVCGRRRRSHAQAQLARGGRLVNWQHLQAFVWLRWRLLVNQWRRGGALNAVLMMILASCASIALAIPLFIGCLLLGTVRVSRGRAAHLMYAWDGLIVAFASSGGSAW